MLEQRWATHSGDQVRLVAIAAHSVTTGRLESGAGHHSHAVSRAVTDALIWAMTEFVASGQLAEHALIGLLSHAVSAVDDLGGGSGGDQVE